MTDPTPLQLLQRLTQELESEYEKFNARILELAKPIEATGVKIPAWVSIVDRKVDQDTSYGRLEWAQSGREWKLCWRNGEEESRMPLTAAPLVVRQAVMAHPEIIDDLVSVLIQASIARLNDLKRAQHRDLPRE